MAGVLDGLSVVDLATTQVGAPVSQLLSDFGADVVMIEPPGGSPTRQIAGYPFWARGKRSVELDLRSDDGRASLREMLRTADVFVETLRPGSLEGLGLSAQSLAQANPRLVHTSITGFGTTGPLAHLKGYEGVVMAKIGGLTPFREMIARPGPAFVSVPYCSFSASQTALHGTLAALYERETSGVGQHVEASMAQAFAAHDTWNWYFNVITDKYPDAYNAAPAWHDGIPTSGFYFRLAVLLTADGRWLQFSQTYPHLFRAYIRVLGLDWMFDDPKWAKVPDFEDEAQRLEFWNILIEAARKRTFAEWQEVFDSERNVWAELFRHGRELLDHPQLLHDGLVVTLDDPDRGPVRQLGPLVTLSKTPADLGTPRTREAHQPAPPAPEKQATASSGLPLEGVTVLEFATMYAAPYASTLLTDLGARVIKVEPLEGDLIRNVLPFPELAGMKVMQGKESIAVNLGTDEGREIVHRLAKSADLALQSYRAGVAKRLGVDAETLRGINPDLIYLNAPGYGVDGPCGDRPAFAPTIGAAAGLAMRNAGESIQERPDLDTAEVRTQSTHVYLANAVVSAQCDGFAALGGATALLLGLLARRRGAGGQVMQTSMLATAGHALGDDMVDYANRPGAVTADSQLLGLHALYRLYETADGWVFLAAPNPQEWDVLVGELDLPPDARFEDARSRAANDEALAAAIGDALRREAAEAWEARLTKRDIACVKVEERGPERVLMGELGRASGYVSDVEHPMYGEHPRLSPLVRFSRSATVAKSACLNGQHTDDILAQIGFSEGDIADLRTRNIVA